MSSSSHFGVASPSGGSIFADWGARVVKFELLDGDRSAGTLLAVAVAGGTSPLPKGELDAR
jgi:crotonobetainyl-CoA:carnitine CoA-transferase CaiB-like acyl-CoA transferase